MILEGCQGKPRTPEILEKVCPQCGSEIELFTCDTQAVCEHCGFVVYNDTLSCVQWCKYAKQCVGEETYEKLMIIARRNQEKADAERRVQQIAGPKNVARHTGFRTPCAVTGLCADCNSPQRICNSRVWLERCYPAGRILVLLIDEEAGL